MSAAPSGHQPEDSTETDRQGFLRRVGRVLLTGFVIIVPFIVLLVLLDIALGFTRGLLEPVIRVLRWAGLLQTGTLGPIGTVLIELGFYDNIIGFYAELVAVLVLAGLIVVLGVFASTHTGHAAVQYVDRRISRIPAIGPVYRSLRQMGDIVLDTGLDDFRAVKLIEFPAEGTYSVAFETNEAPDSVTGATGNDEMATLFVPLAPNPVMGGFLVHVPRDRIYDVDMTVEEAARSIVTSGIAAGEPPDRDRPEPMTFKRMRERIQVDDVTEVTPVDRTRFGDMDDEEE